MRRGIILAIGFAVAVGATAGLAYLALRPAADYSSTAEPEKALTRTPSERGPQPEPQLKIRAYQTTATLVEDLRDALAGDESNLDAECWRVSRALGNSARWTMTKLATEQQESNPRVRALLVLAAGVHVQGEGLLLLSMRDSDARVRQAAVLAAGYAEDGVKTRFLGVSVPLGLDPDERMRAALAVLAKKDPDTAVRDAAKLVLASRD